MITVLFLLPLSLTILDFLFPSQTFPKQNVSETHNPAQANRAANLRR